MLSRLKDYANRLESPPPPLYEDSPVAYTVLLTLDGEPISTKPISRIDSSNPRGKRGGDMVVPSVQRSGTVIRPLLLADDGEYTFGMSTDNKNQERAAKRHESYMDILNRCADKTAEPAVLAVQRFYNAGGASHLELDDSWDNNLKLTFQVLMEDGTTQNPIDLPSVQQFWLEEHLPNPDDVGQCLVCGEKKPTMAKLQSKIKGIRGGNSSGTTIISSNPPGLYGSQGLQDSKTSPCCRECAEDFTRAINSLIAGDETHLHVGDNTFIFWSSDGDVDVASLFQKPNPQQVKALLTSVPGMRKETVMEPVMVGDTDFYAAALSANDSRAVVRDWIETTVPNVQRNILHWFRMQRIMDPRDEDPSGLDAPRPFSLYGLAYATVRKTPGRPAKIPSRIPWHLFRTGFYGVPVPLEIGFAAVQRCRAEQGVTRARAALIKLTLMSQETKVYKEDYMTALETEHQPVAYQCGRLLAVLEEVQRAAIPRVKSTVVDRYYGSASVTPYILGRLIKGAQPHLSKLRRDNRGAYENLQRELESVSKQIPLDFPDILTLKEQSLFALGYYHQRANSRSSYLTATNQKRTNQEED